MAEQCHHCDEPSHKRLGNELLCEHHLADLYRRFHFDVWQLDGVGLPGASTDPTMLTCRSCDATWHGTPGETCKWCARHHQLLIEMQAERVLEPPDVDRDDINYAKRMDAWVDRLLTAVQDKLITPQQAQQALEREVSRGLAA